MSAGPHIEVIDREAANWIDYVVTPASGSDEDLVGAVDGGVVSEAQKLYSVVD